MFSPKNAEQHAAAKACPLEMKTDRQHKLGGAFQAAVERYASDRDEEEDEDELSFAAAQRDVAFLELVSAFVGALCNGVIDVEQAKEPLTHYGRFGGTYDQLVKKLVDVLRDEGIYNGEATTVQHVIGQALQNVSACVGQLLTSSPLASSWTAMTTSQKRPSVWHVLAPPPL